MEGSNQPHAKPSNSRRNIHAYLLSHGRWKDFKGEKNLHLGRIEFTIVPPRYPQIWYARRTPPPPPWNTRSNILCSSVKLNFVWRHYCNRRYAASHMMQLSCSVCSF